MPIPSSWIGHKVIVIGRKKTDLSGRERGSGISLTATAKKGE